MKLPHNKKLDRILADLATVKGMLVSVLQKEDKLMALADDLLADVQDESTVVGSVEALLTNLSAMLANAIAAGDPAKIQAIKDVVDANKARLAAAVTANTPAA